MRGKVVLVTRANSGIGAGTAIHFAAKGCLLALTGRDLTRLQVTLQACIQAGAKEDNLLLILADLQEFENIPKIVEKTICKFGKLDVLVNNAVCRIKNRIMHVTLKDYDAIMNTKLKSVFFLTQTSLPHLYESKGCVVNVSGISAKTPFPDSIVFSMGKASLEHFTRTLALETAAKGVRVNTISLGAVKTLDFEKVYGNFEEFSARIHAMKRGGTIEEAVKSITFLADNEQSSFTTGVALVVDGGALLLVPSRA